MGETREEISKILSYTLILVITIKLKCITKGFRVKDWGWIVSTPQNAN